MLFQRSLCSYVPFCFGKEKGEEKDRRNDVGRERSVVASVEHIPR